MYSYVLVLYNIPLALAVPAPHVLEILASKIAAVAIPGLWMMEKIHLEARQYAFGVPLQFCTL